MAMKMRLKMKSRLHSHMDGHKHTKYKMCLSIMMAIYIITK